MSIYYIFFVAHLFLFLYLFIGQNVCLCETREFDLCHLKNTPVYITYPLVSE